MITDPIREGTPAHGAPMSFAERLARMARHAPSDEEAVDQRAAGAGGDADMSGRLTCGS